MNRHFKTIAVGAGATLLIDCLTFMLSLSGMKSRGVLFVGRWLAYLSEGKFFHRTIIQTPVIANELIIGWAAHYSIGIAFAFLLGWMYGNEWFVKPRIFPALVIGAITLIPPVFILQPALGFGIAFSNTPQPGVLLFKLFLIHATYALGFYKH